MLAVDDKIVPPAEEEIQFLSIPIASKGKFENGSNKDDLQPASSKGVEAAKDKKAKSFLQLLSSLRNIPCRSLVSLSMMWLVILSNGMCYSLISPFLPNEAKRKGMEPATIGALFGCYELVMFVGSPIFSKSAVNRLGLRYMIGAGTLLAGGATILFGLVDQSPSGVTYTALCFSVRIVAAVGASLFVTASYSAAGNIFPENIAFVYSLMETADGGGMTLGPSAGGFLYDAAGFYLPFVTLGCILLIFGCFATIFLPSLDSERHSNANKQPSLPWSRLFFGSGRTWIIALTETVAAILSSFPDPTLSIELESLGLHNKTAIGGIFFGAAAVYTVACIAVGYLADKYPKYGCLVMAIGAFIATVSFFFMGPPPFTHLEPSIAMTATSAIILYSGIALLIIPVPRGLRNIAKEVGFSDGLETSALVAGVFTSLWFLGSFLGPILAGFLLETVGFQWGSTIMSATALGLVLLLIFAAIFIAK